MKNNLLLALSFLVSISCAAASAPSEDQNRLTPIAFLTASEWLATLQGQPDGKTIAIHARFTWAENRRVIRVSNEFVLNGTPKPYIEGMYFWNPQSQKIEFVWSGADGDLSRGTVTPTEGKLVHEFEIVHSDGKAETYTARVTPNADGSWSNEILKHADGKLIPIIQVRYERVLPAGK